MFNLKLEVVLKREKRALLNTIRNETINLKMQELLK